MARAKAKARLERMRRFVCVCFFMFYCFLFVFVFIRRQRDGKSVLAAICVMLRPRSRIMGSEFQLPTAPDQPAPLQLRAVQRLHDWHLALDVKMLTFEEPILRMKSDSQQGTEALPAL